MTSPASGRLGAGIRPLVGEPLPLTWPAILPVTYLENNPSRTGVADPSCLRTPKLSL